MIRVAIRNRDIPRKPRVFDVLVDDTGKIIRYEIQNIRGNVFIDMQDVILQIQEALKVS